MEAASGLVKGRPRVVGPARVCCGTAALAVRLRGRWHHLLVGEETDGASQPLADRRRVAQAAPVDAVEAGRHVLGQAGRHAGLPMPPMPRIATRRQRSSSTQRRSSVSSSARPTKPVVSGASPQSWVRSTRAGAASRPGAARRVWLANRAVDDTWAASSPMRRSSSNGVRMRGAARSTDAHSSRASTPPAQRSARPLPAAPGSPPVAARS